MLKAIVVMRSLFIDRTVVRAFSENVYNEDGKVSFGCFVQLASNKELSPVSFLSFLLSWTFGQSLSTRCFRRYV